MCQKKQMFLFTLSLFLIVQGGIFSQADPFADTPATGDAAAEIGSSGEKGSASKFFGNKKRPYFFVGGGGFVGLPVTLFGGQVSLASMYALFDAQNLTQSAVGTSKSSAGFMVDGNIYYRWWAGAKLRFKFSTLGDLSLPYKGTTYTTTGNGSIMEFDLRGPFFFGVDPGDQSYFLLFIGFKYLKAGYTLPKDFYVRGVKALPKGDNGFSAIGFTFGYEDVTMFIFHPNFGFGIVSGLTLGLLQMPSYSLRGTTYQPTQGSIGATAEFLFGFRFTTLMQKLYVQVHFAGAYSLIASDVYAGAASNGIFLTGGFYF